MKQIIGILLLVFALSISTRAQENNQQEEIEYLTNLCLSEYGSFGNLADICRDYSTCREMNIMNPSVNCQIEYLITGFYNYCRSIQRNDCEAYAVLLVSVSNLHYSTLSGNLSDEEHILRVGAFNSYLTGDYEEAMLSMQAVLTGRYYAYDYRILPIAYGILQSRNEMYEEAILSYTQSIQIQYENPLAYYFRAQAYLALGDTDHAGRDAYTYHLQASELQTSFAPLEVDFERPEMQNWVAYPVVGLGSGPGGDRISDLTLREPIEVKFAVLDDETIALTPLFTTNDKIEFLSLYKSDSDIPYLFIPDRTQYAIIRNVEGQPGVCCGEGSGLVLTDYGNYFVYTSYNYGGESGFEAQGVLFPADIPDPRDSLPPRICEGLPRSNFSIGDNMAYWALAAYSEPSNDSERLSVNWEETAAIIVQGPVCTNDSIWWGVEYGEDKAIGWVRETNDVMYTLFPSDYMIQRDVRAILGLDTP